MSGVGVLFALGMPGPGALLIILMIAVLLYGQRLPEVARNLGKGLAELKKGLRGLEEELHSAMDASSTAASAPAITHAPYAQADDREEATAPKFEPPAGEPKAAPADGPPAVGSSGSELAARTPEG